MNNIFKRTGDDDFPRHLKIMVSGPPKSGKTSLLGTMPGILVLDTEPHANNLQSIAHLNVPYVTIEDTDVLRQVLFMLRDETLRKQVAAQFGWPDVNGVAIDTLDSLQKIMKEERMKEQRSNQFLRDDWGWLKTEMETLLQSFTELPMHVVFLVHVKTQELGKGDESYTVTLPGLEGSISNSIAGMVGYSLLSFRREDVMPDGSLKTNYYLRTEGDGTHDYLGTRTAGRLPTIIEPNLKTIYDAVMAARPAPAVPAAPVPPVEVKTTGEVAQTEGQDGEPQEEVQTPVETPSEPEPTPEPAAEAVDPAPTAATPQAPEAERPTDGESINAAALGHVKKVFDALQIPFSQDKIRDNMSMGEARQIVMMWRSAQQDESEGKLADGRTAAQEMKDYLAGAGWYDESEVQTSAGTESGDVEGKVDGTIDQVMAYVGDDLGRAQEAYDLESQKGSDARATLIKKLEAVGAKPLPDQVTSPETTADAVPTEEEAQRLVEEKLGGEVVSQELAQDAPCDVCGQPIDDYDLAVLGQRRFGKALCVKDYLSEQRK